MLHQTQCFTVTRTIRRIQARPIRRLYARPMFAGSVAFSDSLIINVYYVCVQLLLVKGKDSKKLSSTIFAVLKVYTKVILDI